jgi:hypothetical protein
MKTPLVVNISLIICDTDFVTGNIAIGGKGAYSQNLKIDIRRR